jgi:cobalamin biosynthesis protein CobW
MTAIAQKVPALVVSGFLGSGKTSLVRHLLEKAQQSGIRVAVVSNELGELGIDRALLGSGDEAFIELEGGCVCCELSDDLVETLQLLWEKVRPDRIVVETSGVALPFDTQLNFWRDPVSEWIGEDTAIVVVNAEQLYEERDLEGTFQDQVTSADLLVLNKLDLVPEDRHEEIKARLQQIEPEAPIVGCQRGRVEVDLLFPPSAASRAPDRSGPPPATRPHEHESFEASEHQVDAGTSTKALTEWLRQPDLLRAKGFVETAEGVRLVQVVGRRIEFSEPEETPDPQMLGRLVLIRRAQSG